MSIRYSSMRLLTSVFKGIVSVFLAVIFIIGIGAVLSLLPERTGFHAFVVLSGSMEPAIPTGSLVLVSRRDAYHMGDVVTRRTPGKGNATITHRIVDVSENHGSTTFHTKGDANESADEEDVRKENIVGRVLFSVPYLGYPVHATRTPVGFLFLIALPGIAIVVDEIFSIVRAIRNRKQDRPVVSRRVPARPILTPLSPESAIREDMARPISAPHSGSTPLRLTGDSLPNRPVSSLSPMRTRQSVRRRKIV